MIAEANIVPSQCMLSFSLWVFLFLFWNVSPLQGYWHQAPLLPRKINVVTKTNVMMRYITALWKTTRKQPDPVGLTVKNSLKTKVKQIACNLIIHGKMSSSMFPTSGSQELILFQMESKNLDESICLWHILTRKKLQEWVSVKSFVTI